MGEFNILPYQNYNRLIIKTMIIYGDKQLPEAGKILKSDNEIAFSFPVDKECTEEVIDLSNIKILGNIAMIDDKFAVFINEDRKLKARLINKIFSNDDQIGIMLNYQSHKTTENTKVYKLMQDWRDWFSRLIKLMRDNGTQNN